MKGKKQTAPKATEPKVANVQPGSITPVQALQNVRSIMANVVLIARNNGTEAGLTLNDRVNIEQWFALVKAALPAD